MKKLLLLLSFMAFSLSAAPSLDYQVQNFQDKLVSLNEFKGKVVYLDFWASWCGPCRKSFPWMNAMHQKYQQQGLAIVAINLDENKALAKKFLSKLPADFHIRFDPQADVASKFDLQGMPSSYIFNRQGELVQMHLGFFEEKSADYENEIIELLKE
ncbi:TlpA family protein disulfide reductase [Shewanella sp. Choline-02u-19]|jgi:thiol-disulfide isomerase/thioredoxin|uniref:TlpA family protein disulfide reductase n=1 Tax=unclassified Shewanella TaxID=196818 RepID=UPI000C33DAE6|nr:MULTISPECIES: TlpA disulfide reductase family protein [unclassified Shewanella]PKG55405.1 TlpA family protein disulfide reductase [Shewanella sp. GutDb-MelDb]PKG76104.1 TlpA family protein disulfide reductase [Shewanella sp. GutCb]PKH56614.1 TlpA family protein disulfide reductase [Shewanella sp. Bg11-22]PKI30165.1 TlpA family protein disulfide reductase [Shewanella sp. Choline-02u-19]